MRKKILLLICVVLAAASVLMLVKYKNAQDETKSAYSDDIDQIDLDTIVLEDSEVEVSFSDVILSTHESTRKLIVSTQKGTVSTTLTDNLIKKLNLGIFKKTQTVSYTGTGYFIVDLVELTEDDIVDDTKSKELTIKIPHAVLELVQIDPNDVIIDEVKEGLLARGDIEITIADYIDIEKELQERLTAEFDTAENGQKADQIALEMVKEIYEPIISAVDSRYSINVEFR